MLRPRHIRWLSLLLFSATWSAHAQAGGQEKVWELDLKKALKGELPANPSFKVKSLSFSPDAQQIVVVLQDRAVLIQGQNPKTVLAKFEIDNNDSFGWSADSQIIYSGKHIVRLTDRKACDLPKDTLFPHFVGKDSLVAMSPPSVPFTVARGSFTFPGYRTLGFYDADCKQRDSWDVEESWGITDASPERELLSVAEISGSFRVLIVEPLTRQVLHRGLRQDTPNGWLADSGSAICVGNTCWNVDTSKKIWQSPVSGSASSSGHVAAHASRVVLDDTRESVIPFSSAFTELRARRRVWDFSSNKEVASWPLKFLTYWASFDLDGFNRDRRPIPCAISPNGEYIVEGGDGRIWLYKIQL